jgi:hypothetical protein
VALLAVILVTAIWGVTFVQVKDAVDVYPLFAFLAVRYAIATGVLALVGGRRVLTLGRSGFAAGGVIGVLLGVGIGLQTAGLERTTVSSTGFITGLYVVLTPLFGLLLFRTRVGLEVWAGVVLAVVGLAMLSGVPVGSSGGNLLVLASTAAQALQILMVERYASRDRARPGPARGAARLDGVGRLDRDRPLRERTRLPDPGLGAAAPVGGSDRDRLLARNRFRGGLRLLAGRRSARLARVGRLRGDPGRDRLRRARRKRRAPALVTRDPGLTVPA